MKTPFQKRTLRSDKCFTIIPHWWRCTKWAKYPFTWLQRMVFMLRQSCMVYCCWLVLTSKPQIWKFHFVAVDRHVTPCSQGLSSSLPLELQELQEKERRESLAKRLTTSKKCTYILYTWRKCSKNIFPISTNDIIDFWSCSLRVCRRCFSDSLVTEFMKSSALKLGSKSKLTAFNF